MKIIQSGKINHLEKQFITNIIKFTINNQTSLLKIKFNILIKIYR